MVYCFALNVGAFMQKKPTGWLKASWDTTQAVNARLVDRAARWRDVYDAGGGLASDYIRADFNTDCPVGLDMEPWAEQHVGIQSVFESESYKQAGRFGKVAEMRWGGWVESGVDDTININPLYYSPLALKMRAPVRAIMGKASVSMADIIPHEFIHTRQQYSDKSGWTRQNHGNDVEHVGMHELSKLKKMWRQTVRACHNAAAVVTTGASTVGDYYARNVEMQARMHEALAYGYVQWQRLPTDRLELSAALVNLGFDAPKSVIAGLNATDDGRRALEGFKVMPSIRAEVSGTVSTFNRVHDYIGEVDVQEAMWEAKYPLLYGELIEFYGDKMGRERLGLGENPRPAIEALYALKAYDGVLCDVGAQELAERVPASLGAAFVNCIASEYPQGADGFDNAMALCGAFLARDDVRSCLFEGEPVVNMSGAQCEEPPLVAALHSGDVAMVRLLLDAGADPFQRYHLVDMRGKAVMSVCPMACVENVVNVEKALADPSSLPKALQKFYADENGRASTVERMANMRAALAVVADCCGDSNVRLKFYGYGGGCEDVSLNQVLERIGMGRGGVERDCDAGYELS
jgi:hypothetical protein